MMVRSMGPQVVAFDELGVTGIYGPWIMRSTADVRC